MKTSYIVASAITCTIIALIVIGGLLSMSIDNREIELWERIDAQQKNCFLIHDKMKKIIFETCKLKDDSSDDFERIYEKLMKASRGDGGQDILLLMQGHSQAPAPEFLKLSQEVMRNVEHYRSELAAEEKKLLDFNADRNKYVQQAPNRWFVERKEKYPTKIVTSDATQKAFDSGVENESSLPERKR